MSKGGIALGLSSHFGEVGYLNFFKINRIPYSTFGVGRSMFGVPYFDIQYSLYFFR